MKTFIFVELQINGAHFTNGHAERFIARHYRRIMKLAATGWPGHVNDFYKTSGNPGKSKIEIIMQITPGQSFQPNNNHCSKNHPQNQINTSNNPGES
jgi:hypothetical protein